MQRLDFTFGIFTKHNFKRSYLFALGDSLKGSPADKWLGYFGFGFNPGINKAIVNDVVIEGFTDKDQLFQFVKALYQQRPLYHMEILLCLEYLSLALNGRINYAEFNEFFIKDIRMELLSIGGILLIDRYAQFKFLMSLDKTDDLYTSGYIPKLIKQFKLNSCDIGKYSDFDFNYKTELSSFERAIGFLHAFNKRTFMEDQDEKITQLINSVENLKNYKV